MATAEKFKIFEAEIDTRMAVEATIELKKEINDLKARNKELKQSEQELTPEYVQNEAKIKALSAEMRRNENVTKAVEQSNISLDGSLNQLKAQLSVVTAEWNELSEEERLNSARGKELTDAKTKLTAALLKEEKATGDARRQVGFYERAVEGNIQAVGQYVPAAGKAASAAKMLGGAFKVMLGPVGILIGLIAVIVKSFQTFFNSTEEGQNTLRRFKMIFTTVFDSVNRILVGFAETMIKAFTDPKQAIADLWEAIKTNFVNRITGVVDQVKAFGSILQGVFELDWEKIKQGGKDYADATIQILTGVENAIDKVSDGFKNLADEQSKRIAEAERIARLQDQLDNDQRKTLVENAKLQTEIDKLREDAAKKEEFTAKQRLAILDEAIEKERQIEDNNIRIARQKLEIRQAQNELTLSTREDLEAEAQLQAELINVEGAAARKRRELESQRVEAIRAIRAEEKALSDAEFKAIEEQFAAIEEEIQKELQLKKEALDAEAAMKEQARLMELERLQTDFDNRMAIAESDLFKRIDIEREGLEMQRQLELQYAEKIGADTNLINEKYDQLDMQLEREKQMAKLGIAASFSSQLADLFGENTKLGKAAAVAATAINTYQGAMAAFAQTPGGIVIKSAAAALATATGIKAISDILKVKTNIKAGTTQSISPMASNPAPMPVTPMLGSSIATQGVPTAPGQLSQSAIGGMRSSQSVLVVDEVTAAQQAASRNRRIGTI
jgi:hypothetical protein